MTITPADSLDLLIARGPPDATDFAKQIAGLPGAYYAGLDEAYKRRTQDAFQGGVPTTADGQIDLPSIYKTALTTGGTPAAIEVAKGLQQQGIQQGLQNLSGRVFGDTGTAPAIIPGAPPSTTVSAPSLPRIPSDGTGQSVTGIISSSPFTGQQANYVAAAIKRQLGFDQTQQLSPQQADQVQQFVAQIPRPSQQPPTANQTVADRFPGPTGSPPVPSVANDPTLGGLVPPGRTVEQQLSMLRQAAGAAEAAQKGAGKVYFDAIDAIQKRLQPTEDQKNYLANKLPGENEAQYKARTAAATETAKGVAGVGVDLLKTAQANYTASQNSLYGLDLIDHSIASLPAGWMGTGAATRLEIAKGLNTFADSILPANLAATVKINPNAIANLEDFNKQSLKLGFETAKTLGSREAMQVVQQATKSVPNFEQSPLGAKLVSSSLRQAAQRGEDFYKYIAQHPGQVGADIEFNKQNPPEMYSTRAVAASGIPVPLKTGDERKIGWLPSGTKYTWNGKPWTAK